MDSNEKRTEDNLSNVNNYEDTAAQNQAPDIVLSAGDTLPPDPTTDKKDEDKDTSLQEISKNETLDQNTNSLSSPHLQRLPTAPAIATFEKNDASSSFYMYMLAAFRPEDLERHLSAGFDINEADRFGSTAMMYAKLYGDEKAEETLLNKGAQKTQERIVINDQFMFLQVYNAATNHLEPFLLEEICQVLGCNLELFNEAGETVLLAAVRDSNMNAILNLLEAGAQIDDQIIQEARNNEQILEILQSTKKQRFTAAPKFEKMVGGSSVDPACFAPSISLVKTSATSVYCSETNNELHWNKVGPSNAGNDQTERNNTEKMCAEQQHEANSVTNIGQATVKTIGNASQESLTEKVNCVHDNLIHENGSESIMRDNCEHDNVDVNENGSESIMRDNCEHDNVDVNENGSESIMRDNCDYNNVDVDENGSESVMRDIRNTELNNRLEEESESLKSIDGETESTAELILTKIQDDNELETCPFGPLSKSTTDNNYKLDHIAEESNSRIEIMQTTNEVELTTRQSDSQELEKGALEQNECEIMDTDHKVMPSTPAESESGFFSMRT